MPDARVPESCGVFRFFSKVPANGPSGPAGNKGQWWAENKSPEKIRGLFRFHRGNHPNDTEDQIFTFFGKQQMNLNRWHHNDHCWKVECVNHEYIYSVDEGAENERSPT